MSYTSLRLVEDVYKPRLSLCWLSRVLKSACELNIPVWTKFPQYIYKRKRKISPIYIYIYIYIYILGEKNTHSHWAGIAQWLERRTRDWKVAGSNPCWNGGRIFFSRVDFLCWLLFRYPFHPRVTTVARKKFRSFCQKCRCQVTTKHAYTLRMWILLNRASALVTTCP